jgi:non-homologous end joining protein Ku
MQPLWPGSLSFGLIKIPVKLLSSMQQDEPDFEMLSKKDLAPVA